MGEGDFWTGSDASHDQFSVEKFKSRFYFCIGIRVHKVKIVLGLGNFLSARGHPRAEIAGRCRCRRVNDRITLLLCSVLTHPSLDKAFVFDAGECRITG